MIPLDHGKQSVSELAHTKKYMLPLRDQFRNREISEIYFSRSGLDLQAWEEVSSDSQNDRSQRRYIKGLGWNCTLDSDRDSDDATANNEQIKENESENLLIQKS